jgi:hypothetical protein
MDKAVTLDAVLDLVKQLSPLDQVRLIEHIAPQLEQALAGVQPQSAPARQDAWGALAHLGPAPSAEDIDEARREEWANFPREDI